MKKVLALVLVFVMTLALTGCGQKTSQITKVTVSEVTHSVFYAPQYVAINLGLFEKHGLEVSLINGGGADNVMTAVLSNQVEIGLAGAEASIYVYLQGKTDYPMVFTQLTTKDGSFLVGREEEDFSWQNLAGKHILPGRKGGSPYMALEYAIKKNGLNPQTDMNFDNSISFDAMTAAFLGGVGDYVTIYEPTATMVENEGKGVILASVGEEAGEMPFTTYFAKQSYMEKHPEIIQNFVDAIYEGQTWVKTHTAKEIAEVIAPSFPDSDLAVLEKVAQRYKEIDAWSKTPNLSKESFDRLQDVIMEAGELEAKVPYEKLVTNTYADIAVGK